MGDSQEDPTAQNHAAAVRTAADHIAAVRSAVDLAVGDRTAAVRGVDSQEVHMEEVHMVAALTEVDHMEVDHMEVDLTAMAAIAKSEFQHPHLGIHHTTYFAH